MPVRTCFGYLTFVMLSIGCCWVVGAETWTVLGPQLRAQPLSRTVATFDQGKDQRQDQGKIRFVSLPAAQTGVDFTNRLDWNHPQGVLFSTGYACGALVVGDVDGNGLPDLFFAGGSGPNRLYLQKSPWNFVESWAVAVLSAEDQLGQGDQIWETGAALFDIDNDGDLDLYVCNYDAPNALYINRGDGTFEQRAEEFGLDIVDACLMPAVADFDRDGDLDIYLAVNRYMIEKRFRRDELFIWRDGMEYLRPAAEKYFTIRRHFDRAEQLNMWAGRKDRLLRNEGPGQPFTDVSQQMGLQRGDTLAATWWDYDHDGWPDLYVCNDLAAPDRLFHNNRDGSLQDVALQSLPHTPLLAMGASAGDINNDGLVDLLVADMSFRTHFKDKVFMGDMTGKFRNVSFFPNDQLMRNALFVNSGTEYFQEAAYLAGLASTDWTWSAKLADFDNDGRLDAFFTNGSPVNLTSTTEFENSGTDSEAFDTRVLRERYRKLPPVLEQNLVYQNEGDLHFVDQSAAWGLNDVGMSFAAVHADIDRDGDLDLIVANLDRPPLLYRNDSQTPGFLVHLLGKRSNRFGIGAELVLETDEGQQVRQIYPVAGFQSCQEAAAHFGLGSATRIRRLTVRWPSGAEQTFEDLPSGFAYLVQEPETEAEPAKDNSTNRLLSTRLFAQMSNVIVAEHHEQPFDDFARQPLLPNKLSQLGPPMAWGDVDGDGDADLFLGEGTDWMGMFYMNQCELDQGNMSFVPRPQVALARDAAAEDSTATFLDANGDGHLDLYVGSGSIECEPGDEILRDRLYFGDGTGNFETAAKNWLPNLRISTGAVAANDFDHDGDVDLVVCGRSIPGKYPLAPEHALLRNEGDHLANRISEMAPDLINAGMITAAVWADVNGDGWDDLIVATDWGPLRIYRNQRGKLVETTGASGLGRWTGWWQSLASADLDGDGDVDLVAGNFGLNTKYRASPARPVLAYYGEYGKSGEPGESGHRNFIEASYENGVLFPLRGKSCSSLAMPHLGKRFSTYEQFAKATLAEIYTPQCLQQAERLEVNTLTSACFLNDGSGRFEILPLPPAAQLAPVFAIAVTEVNGDGVVDLFLGQNFFGPQQETGPMDGGLGVVALGRGDGRFEAIRPDRAGIAVPGDIKAVAAIDFDGDHWRDLCVATNNGPLKMFRHQGTQQRTWSPPATLADSSWREQSLALARPFFDSNQSEQSLPYLRRALKVAPQDPEALLLLAVVRLDQRQLGEAKRLLDRLQNSKGVDETLLNLEVGRLFYLLKQYDRAAEILRKVVTDSPRNRRGHLDLGQVRLKQGRLKEAQKHFQAAQGREQ